MKIVTILGSPRKKGNTAQVLGWMEDELIALGHTVDHVFLKEHLINGCVSCCACQKKPDEPGCVQKDGAPPLFARFLDAGGILYASPLYMWGFPGALKCLLDRHLSLAREYMTPNHRSFIEGIRTGLLLTCGGPVENNTELIQEMYARIMGYIKSDDAGCFIVPDCNFPAIGNFDPETEEKARHTAKHFFGQA